jgi:hypothetical protein
MPTFSDDPTKRAAEEKCVADVERHGLHILHIYGDAEWPEFAYSVGLHRNFSQAEVIVLGLPKHVGHGILNRLADLSREGRRFRAGDTTDEILNGYSVTFRPVPPGHLEAHFGWAIWFYGEEAFPALQLVFPDREGHWPWDPAASDAFRAQQPVLAAVDLPAWARASA